MNNNWLCISNVSNYKVTISNNIWGVESKYKSKLEQLKIGDKIIFYLKGKLIGGIFEVKSELFFDNDKIFNGGIYPYRIKLKPIKSFDNIYPLTDEMIKNLDLFNYKDKRWKLTLFGRTILALTDKDFNYLKSMI
jgi:predicted RNA-binding protein